MKKFKLRESMRQTEKVSRMTNFLKMANTTNYRNQAATIFFHKKDDKLKTTLTSLLA